MIAKGESMVSQNVRTEQALRGEILYGDDFSLKEIEQWFEDERDGYFNLSYESNQAPPGEEHRYEYSELAEQHGYGWLPPKKFDKALGIGSAHGAELKPILMRSQSVTVLEPAEGFAAQMIDGKPVTYVQPVASGVMPFESAAFDIAVCFSVLHHIPNVSTVINEMFRVLKPGGYALIREPTLSMGDWRQPRRGLTKRERGIPLPIFRRLIEQAGFEVVRETRCMFSLTSRLSHFLQRPVWTYKFIAALDAQVCKLPFWPGDYHATNFLQKFRPTAVAYVLRRPLTTSGQGTRCGG